MTDSIEHHIKAMERQLAALTCVLGLSAGLLIAMLAGVITLSYQFGHLSGRLAALIAHVSPS